MLILLLPIYSGQNEEIHDANIHFKDIDIIDSSYAAISFIEGKTFGVTFENVNINGTGTYVLQLQTGGEAIFRNVNVEHVQQSVAVYSCGAPFNIKIEGAHSGWSADKHDCHDLQSLHPNYPW